MTQLVLGHLQPDWRIEIEVEADVGSERQNVPFHTNPGRSRSRAVRVGNRVLLSCTAPMREEDLKPADADPLVQTRTCWEVISNALRAAGAGPEHVVKARFHIRHRTDRHVIAQFTREVFSEARPAITVIDIAGYLQPSWRVEIEVEAII
jgi:enamine deaminase RidA (YjgF/YER057c/UK114 family)